MYFLTKFYYSLVTYLNIILSFISIYQLYNKSIRSSNTIDFSIYSSILNSPTVDVSLEIIEYAMKVCDFYVMFNWKRLSKS